MRNSIAIFIFIFTLAANSAAWAQWGDLLKSVQGSPLLTQTATVQNIIGKAQSIASLLSKMPLNSGKLELAQAALPLMQQVQSLSGDVLSLVQKGQGLDTAKTTQMGSLLDKVKGLFGQQWSSNPLTAAQVPQATSQIQNLSGILSNILSQQGSVAKSLAQAATAPAK